VRRVVSIKPFGGLQLVYVCNSAIHSATSSRLTASRNWLSINFCRSTEMILPPSSSRT
jgi:hypothetical protein